MFGICVTLPSPKDDPFINLNTACVSELLGDESSSSDPCVDTHTSSSHLGSFFTTPEAATAEQQLTEYIEDDPTACILDEKRILFQSLTTSDNEPSISLDKLRTHAGITTNLGRLLYFEDDLVTAMHLYQESLHSLMCLDSTLNNPKAASYVTLPSQERHEEMEQLLRMLSCRANTPQSRRGLCEVTRKLFIEDPEQSRVSSSSRSFFRNITNGGFPGLFKKHFSKLRVSEAERMAGLTFGEPFRVDLEPEGKETEPKHFIIPLEQCPKATLYNIGLIHYRSGRAAAAMQFFDLSSSMSQQLSPLAFDPIILASFNNMAQIHLQYGRVEHAMQLLQDALVRGRAALTALYGDQGADWKADTASTHLTREDKRKSNDDSKGSPQVDTRCFRRLRRKLARTVMNIGHVHYVNCEYKQAMNTCYEALRLLYPHTEDPEVTSVWHNMGVLFYHQDQKQEAVDYLQKFIEKAEQEKFSSSNLCHDLQVAEAYALQGVAIYEMGKLYDCMRPLNEALKIRRWRLGQKHPLIAESLCSIGRVLQAREEYDFCLKVFSDGLSIHRSASSDGWLSLDAAQTILDLGRAFHAQHRIPEAIRVYEEAIEVTCRFFGTESVPVARLLNIVGNLHLELGEVGKAIQLFTQEMNIHLQQGLPVHYSVAENPICCVLRTLVPTAPMA